MVVWLRLGDLFVSQNRLTSNISHEKTWMRQRKGNFKRKTGSLLIAAQNNSIRTNHIKERIDDTQQNSRSRLCGDRDETINHIISTLAQKEYKTRHDRVGKIIHRELCKKLKFDHTNKWYMYNSVSVLKMWRTISSEILRYKRIIIVKIIYSLGFFTSANALTNFSQSGSSIVVLNLWNWAGGIFLKAKST